MTTQAWASVPARFGDMVRGFDRALLAVKPGRDDQGARGDGRDRVRQRLASLPDERPHRLGQGTQPSPDDLADLIGGGPVLRLGGHVAVNNRHAVMIAKVWMQDLYHEVYPMLAVQLVVLVFPIFVPVLSTGLPYPTGAK